MDVIRITLLPIIQWMDWFTAQSWVIILFLLLNSISVSFTHTLRAFDHTHWSHKVWTIPYCRWMLDRWRVKFGVDPHITKMDFCLLPSLFTWYHVFSFLRWPMMLVFVWPLPWIWWIICALVAQFIWMISKDIGQKDWPNKFKQFWRWLV
jgi:hypothetical protein